MEHEDHDEEGVRNLRRHLLERSTPKGKKAKNKVHKTMAEFKAGTLHSGSPSGPLVTNRKQAIAIGLSQARRAA